MELDKERREWLLFQSAGMSLAHKNSTTKNISYKTIKNANCYHYKKIHKIQKFKFDFKSFF